ncbi:helix-turn-helix domain-containing protein [Seonamhaeicola aphaedonensis]|uniref:Excisionase family DNA binding protein n=1 Tax=Seonamhaeicola aphaedonensis TaxID=1461338 RepID=A0A3D9HH12_9FLAO|nr:helix-turn-helix domain-containing protein [Seonamhaeicola aphaedonensis]RED48799.1 excisionase family DNA binding protein [Seonamhaeicola aphaedonensis]
MEKSILLHNITPNELKDLIIADLKIELEKILNRVNEQENYSVDEVSKLLDCSKLTVYNYIKKGVLPASKIGRRHIIKKSDLDASIKEVKSLKYKR